MDAEHGRVADAVCLVGCGRRAEARPLPSPLGELYRREMARQRLRYPALDTALLDWIVAVALARLFLDADAAELARAIREGSPLLGQRMGDRAAAYADRLAHRALAIARAPRDDAALRPEAR